MCIRDRSQGRIDKVYSLFGMFLILYGLIGLLAFGAGLGFYFNVTSFFEKSLTLQEIEEARIIIFLMILNVAVSFPLGVFGSIIIAYENFVFQKVSALRILEELVYVQSFFIDKCTKLISLQKYGFY